MIRILMNKIYKNLTWISEMYTENLDGIVNEYNNKFHSTIKRQPANVKSSTYINFGIEIMIKILNLNLGVILEHQNIETVLSEWRIFCH